MRPYCSMLVLERYHRQLMVEKVILAGKIGDRCVALVVMVLSKKGADDEFHPLDAGVKCHKSTTKIVGAGGKVECMLDF